MVMHPANDLSRRANSILTIMGIRQKGFYTPYDYVSSITGNIPPYPAIAELFLRHRKQFQEFIDEIAAREQLLIDTASGFPQPDWNSAFISPLDGAVIYTGVATFAPKRIVEIGSGNSTYFMLRAIVDHKLDTLVTCIDPKPRIAINDLPVQFERRLLSCSDTSIFATFRPGDVLFVDSSHIMQQGYDVDIIMNHIFPILPSGTIVHLHDIFLPYAYPSNWSPFRFNEQQALIGWLVSGYFEPIFASYYAYRDMVASLEQATPRFPIVTEQNGGSLWLRKT
jgi:predicted O-methyltransferase YrrM